MEPRFSNSLAFKDLIVDFTTKLNLGSQKYEKKTSRFVPDATCVALLRLQQVTLQEMGAILFYASVLGNMSVLLALLPSAKCGVGYPSHGCKEHFATLCSAFFRGHRREGHGIGPRFSAHSIDHRRHPAFWHEPDDGSIQ